MFSLEAASKLKAILVKRTGRDYSQEEIEQAYQVLLSFGEIVIDLNFREEVKERTKSESQKFDFSAKNSVSC